MTICLKKLTMDVQMVDDISSFQGVAKIDMK